MSEQEPRKLIPKAILNGSFLSQVSNVSRNTLPDSCGTGLTLEEGLGYWARRNMTAEQFRQFRKTWNAQALEAAFRNGLNTIRYSYDDPAGAGAPRQLSLHLFTEAEGGDVLCVGSVRQQDPKPADQPEPRVSARPPVPPEPAPEPAPQPAPEQKAEENPASPDGAPGKTLVLSRDVTSIVKAAIEDLQVEMEMERTETRKKHRRTVFWMALFMVIVGLIGGAVLDQRVAVFSGFLGQFLPAQSTEAPPEATPVPTAEPVPRPEPVTEYVVFNSPVTFTADVMENGTARISAASANYHALTVTAQVSEVMGPEAFAKLYARQPYSLDGTEACVRLTLSFTSDDGTETLVPQDAFRISVTDAEGNPLQSYQLMDQPMGGAYHVTIRDSADVYKRFDYTDAARYLLLTCYQDGTQHNLYFALRYDDPNVSYEGLKAGDRGPVVLAMKARLAALGYLSERSAAYQQYDQGATAAVKAAQEAFGMEVTGVADTAFLKELFSR